MLVSSSLAQVPTVERLVKIWSARYLPDLSRLTLDQDPCILTPLHQAFSAEGRTRTVTKLHENLDKNSKLAVIKTKDLYTRRSDALAFKEALELAESSHGIYMKLLDFYQDAPPTTLLSIEQLWSTFNNASISTWGIPEIDQLADAVEPLMLTLQAQHIQSKDWRSLGFITTQFNFNNVLLLEELTLVEQVLVNPYLKFVEEQVALPWQRVCAAAAKYDVDSPAFILVEQLLPLASKIANNVYSRLLDFFPHHYSRRGSLENAAIKHSCLRDLNMFQAYLWLALLEENLKCIEQELVPLCTMVMETLEVQLELSDRWSEFLIEGILRHLDFQQQQLIQPYTQGLMRAFSRDRFDVKNSRARIATT